VLLSLALAIMPPQEVDMAAWGIQTLEVIQREFAFERTPGFADAIEPGKPRQPVFNWGLGVLLSAMNGAARVDPAWRKPLRDLIEASRTYWNSAGPVAGFDVWPMPKPRDRYYDDNAWMVMALVEASEILKDPKILTLAEEALTFVLSGEDLKLGGGIYWRENGKKSKNTCSNGPAVAACLAVYESTKRPELLAKAKRIYDWTRKNLQDSADDLFWDSKALSGKVDPMKWSYNTALMIRSAAELARITEDSRYRQEAEAMAKSSEKKWLIDGRIADEGRFAHLLLESWNYVPTDDRMQKAREAVKWVWEHCRTPKGLFGNRFDKAPTADRKKFELIDQASAARAFFYTAK
jgi:rhamnogalacturonyl hydrolase YesR